MGRELDDFEGVQRIILSTLSEYLNLAGWDPFMKSVLFSLISFGIWTLGIFLRKFLKF